jgi:hypothetical protein
VSSRSQEHARLTASITTSSKQWTRRCKSVAGCMSTNIYTTRQGYALCAVSHGRTEHLITSVMQDFERLALGHEVTGIGIGTKGHPNWHWYWHWQIVSSVADKHVWSRGHHRLFAYRQLLQLKKTARRSAWTERPTGLDRRSLAVLRYQRKSE